MRSYRSMKRDSQYGASISNAFLASDDAGKAKLRLNVKFRPLAFFFPIFRLNFAYPVIFACRYFAFRALN